MFFLPFPFLLASYILVFLLLYNKSLKSERLPALFSKAVSEVENGLTFDPKAWPAKNSLPKLLTILKEFPFPGSEKPRAQLSFGG